MLQDPGCEFPKIRKFLLEFHLILGTVAISGTRALPGLLATLGALAISGILVIPGALAIPGTLAIPGPLAIPGALAIPGPLAVAGTLAIPGTQTILGTVARLNFGKFQKIEGFLVKSKWRVWNRNFLPKKTATHLEGTKSGTDKHVFVFCGLMQDITYIKNQHFQF